jgi:hypothetical protein
MVLSVDLNFRKFIRSWSVLTVQSRAQCYGVSLHGQLLITKPLSAFAGIMLKCIPKQ